MNSLEQKRENSGVSRVTGPLRRFGENFVEQARLRARYAAAIAAPVVMLAATPPVFAGGKSFMGDVGNAEEPPHAGESVSAESAQSEIPLEFPPLVPVGPKGGGKKAGWNLYLVRPDGKEEQILAPSILSLKADPCVDCVVELRCRGPKVREELDPPPQIFRLEKGEGKKKKRKMIEVEETLVAKVTALRGKTTTFGCAGEDFEDPESPGGWQLFVPALVTPPMPAEEAVSESAPLPSIEVIPSPPPVTPLPERPQVFLTRVDRPDEEIMNDEFILTRDPGLARLEARCPEGVESNIIETVPPLGDKLYFDPRHRDWMSAPLAPLEKMVVRCGDGPSRTIIIIRGAAPESASTAETTVSKKRWSVEAGATLPTASTDNLFPLEPGAFVRARRKFGNHFGASAGVSWNPVRQGLTRRHMEFVSLNANQRLRGNAFRVTAGPFATGRVPLSNLVHMDFNAGINAGATLSSVGRKNDVAVDRNGQLADIPNQLLAAPVAEMCGSVSFGVRERLSGVVGICTGTSIGRVQTAAADPKGEVLTFVEPMGGVRVEF